MNLKERGGWRFERERSSPFEREAESDLERETESVFRDEGD